LYIFFSLSVFFIACVLPKKIKIKIPYIPQALHSFIVLSVVEHHRDRAITQLKGQVTTTEAKTRIENLYLATKKKLKKKHNGGLKASNIDILPSSKLIRQKSSKYDMF